MQFICHKIHQPEVCSSVDFGMFTEMSNYHHCPISELFHHLKEEGPHLSAITPHSSPPTRSPAAATLLPVSVDVSVLFRIGGLMHSLAFCVCLLWLNMFARVIPVVTNIKFIMCCLELSMRTFNLI